MEDIYKEFYPESGELTRDKDGTYQVQLLDEEGDPMECTFNYDNCIHINTKELNYIDLSVHTLYKMIELIEETTELYKDEFAKDRS